jgi:hypothetical protein
MTDNQSVSTSYDKLTTLAKEATIGTTSTIEEKKKS